MDVAILVVSVVGVVLGGVNLVLELRHSRGSDGLTKRGRTRLALARQSVAYARQVGKDDDDRMRHALSHFRLLDKADNGVNDFSDAEARLAITTVLGQEK